MFLLYIMDDGSITMKNAMPYDIYLICFNNNFYLIHTWFYVGGSFIMLRILWIYPWGRWDLWLKINDDSKKEKYWERKWKKEIYLYYGVLNNIHGDINYVEDGECQQQLVEGGDHLRLPVSYSWFNLSVSRSVADTLSFIDFIFFQCFAKTK